MRLVTTQLCHWRKFKDKDKYLFIDSSRKSGQSLFAPSWYLLERYKTDKIDQETYVREFYVEMLESVRLNRKAWIDLIEEKRIVVLGCYCRAETFCHRLLLKDILQRISIKLGLPFEYMGEMPLRTA